MASYYYLSEMAVSDQHGGGLTLQRVLQDNLQTFHLFVHLDEFATRVAPITNRFADRQLNLHEIYPPSRVRARSARDHFDRALTRLHLKASLSPSLSRWSRLVADHISSSLPLEGSSWFVAPQNMRSVLVMNHVWRCTPVRYVTWVMDDHVVKWNNGWKYPSGFESEFRFHLRHAQKVFVISPAMQRLYRHRFGVDSAVLFGPADVTGTPVYQSPRPSGPVRLAYFGAIREWQCDALHRLVTHLAGSNVTLDLFGLQSPPSQLRLPMVRVHPPVQAKDVIPKMREYDGVVIAASFRNDLRHLTELNIATKMSECLASGTVPVIVAPDYAAMAQFAREHGGALILSDFGDSQRDALRSLKAQHFREPILRDAWRVVNSQCSLAVMRRRLATAWNVDGPPSSDTSEQTHASLQFLPTRDGASSDILRRRG